LKVGVDLEKAVGL